MRCFALASCLALVGCTSIGTCRDGTIFLTLEMDDAAATSDSVLIAVDSRTATVAHVPGRTSGSVEVQFPGGYPAGQNVTVTATALAGGAPVGEGSRSLTLDGKCAAATVSLFGTGVGGNGGDDLAMDNSDLAGVVGDMAMSVAPDFATAGPCAHDTDCATGTYCAANGACVAQKAQGAQCNAASDCKEASCRVCATGGGCIDGYCCNGACPGSCQQCNVPGFLGVCKIAPKWSSGRDCAALHYCNGSNTGCATCPAAPAAGELHYVDPRGVNDTSHGSGYGACGYKTVTYALTQATGQVALWTASYSAASGETMPLVLRGNQQLLCKYQTTSPASLVGKAQYDRIFIPVTVAFEGGLNGLYDCVVDGTGTSTGYCVDVFANGASPMAGHVISGADIGHCSGSAVNVESNIGNLLVTGSKLHDSLTGVFWIGSNNGGTMSSNTFANNSGKDIQCQNADPGVTGSGNKNGTAATNCQTCGGCPF